jgi:hypothetical protein
VVLEFKFSTEKVSDNSLLLLTGILKLQFVHDIADLTDVINSRHVWTIQDTTVRVKEATKVHQHKSWPTANLMVFPFTKEFPRNRESLTHQSLIQSLPQLGKSLCQEGEPLRSYSRLHCLEVALEGS